MKLFERWMIFPGVMVLAGAAGALNKLINGEHALGTTAAMPWGLLIAGYVFFAAAATGVGLISGVGHFTGKSEWLAIEKRGMFLALSLLLPGFGLIGIELGNPLNMIYIIFSPNFQSGIWWMGFLYSIYMGLLLVECYFSQVKPEKTNLKLIGALAIVNKIAAVCNLGAIFALITTRPFWHGTYFPVYILVTAVLSGAAALIVALYLSSVRKGLAIDRTITAGLTKVILATLAITLAMNIWKVVSGLNSNVPGLREATAALIYGPYALRFWLLEIGLGLVLPLVLVLKSIHNARRLFAAAVLILTGVFTMRMDFVAIGQMIPQTVVEGIGHIQLHAYTPSWTEWSLLAGAIGASTWLYFLSEKRLKLDHAGQSPFTDIAESQSFDNKGVSL